VPIYDYVCETCGHVMEVIHGIDADGPDECPLCGGPMSKAFSAPAVHFKGSGWAKKDRKSVSGPVKSRASSEGGGSDAAAGPAEPSSASDTAATSSAGSAGDGPKEG
jgi:putative FmdB family regulatory protein